MMMYYDARPCVFNGLFDYYTQRPLKGYYPFKMYNELYRLGNACKASSNDLDIYISAACGEDDRYAIMIAYYTDKESAPEKSVGLDLKNGKSEYDIYLLDDKRNYEFVGNIGSNGELIIHPNTVILLKT